MPCWDVRQLWGSNGSDEWAVLVCQSSSEDVCRATAHVLVPLWQGYSHTALFINYYLVPPGLNIMSFSG